MSTPETPVAAPVAKHVRLGEFKGNPMIVFQSEAGDRFPFQFGKGKAERILAAIDEFGVDRIVDLLRQIAK